MDKNPFSLFDFLGYFIPGAFALFLVFFLQHQCGLLYYFDLTNIPNLNREISLVYLIFFIILSYTLGHILSMVSALTIERFTVKMFDYPSKNLLNNDSEKSWIKNYFFDKKEQSRESYFSIVLLILLFVFLLPISILTVILGTIFKLNQSIYTKSLDNHYIKMIKSNVEKIFKNHDHELDFNKEDYHKLLIFYSYDINQAHQPKLMNYVALYGFLRVISFILNCLSLVLVYELILDFRNFQKIVLTIVVFLLSYFSYLGYLKFYRRYSQENLMILLLNNGKQ